MLVILVLIAGVVIVIIVLRLQKKSTPKPVLVELKSSMKKSENRESNYADPATLGTVQNEIYGGLGESALGLGDNAL